MTQLKWINLPENFEQGLRFVYETSAKCRGRGVLDFIHFAGECLFATNDFQLARYTLTGNTQINVLIPWYACRYFFKQLPKKIYAFENKEENFLFFKRTDGTMVGWETESTGDYPTKRVNRTIKERGEFVGIFDHFKDVEDALKKEKIQIAIPPSKKLIRYMSQNESSREGYYLVRRSADAVKIMADYGRFTFIGYIGQVAWRQN